MINSVKNDFEGKNIKKVFFSHSFALIHSYFHVNYIKQKGIDLKYIKNVYATNYSENDPMR